MARDDSKSRVKVTSNFNAAMADLSLAGFQGKGIRARVWTDIKYAIYVEFGTANMFPRAMVRRSIPAIELKFAEEIKGLPMPPTEQAIQALVARVVEFAREEIVRRTPVQSGDLQKSWKVEGPELI